MSLEGEDEVTPKTVEEEEIEVVGEEELLLPITTLLSAGIHIGTRIKTGEMSPFVFRIRPDGLFVLDVKKTDDRIRTAAKFLAQFEPSKIVVVSARLYGKTPVLKFCETTSALPIVGRFMPGLLSNPSYEGHMEPEVILVSDPRADQQAVNEASTLGIPVIALCDTDNNVSQVDLVVPTNNKGRRALATVFWLIARQLLRERGELSEETAPKMTIDDFETKLTEISMEISSEE
jgi:small subunit ribosomal protein S2